MAVLFKHEFPRGNETFEVGVEWGSKEYIDSGELNSRHRASPERERQTGGAERLDHRSLNR